MTFPTKTQNSIGARPASPSAMSAGPMMGAPVLPKANTDGTHSYLGAHKAAFPAGFTSQGQPPVKGPGPRSPQGVVGYDVAKGNAKQGM
jgi:hypothetical protein